MKKAILHIALSALVAGGLFACSDWTEPEPRNYFEPKSESYYAALRDYKKSDHQVTFGWFGNWTATGTSLRGSLMGLPDSVDFVSMWGNWHSLSPEKKEDLRQVKTQKGTKVLMCFIVANVGDQTTPADVRDNWRENGFASEEAAVHDFWGYVQGDEEKMEAAVRKYARSLVDTIDKYNWDGFDFDYEANYGASGNIAGPASGDTGNPDTNRASRPNFKIFVDELSKYLGPKSGTGRLLVIDGEPQNMHPDSRDCFDYYIIQAYSSTGDSDLDTRYTKLLKGLEATTPELIKMVSNRLIYCENFEEVGYAAQGGRLNYRTREGQAVPSLVGMALWQPTTGYTKGGIGTYHMEYDYPNNPEYKWLRIATGIMNPFIL